MEPGTVDTCFAGVDAARFEGHRCPAIEIFGDDREVGCQHIDESAASRGNSCEVFGNKLCDIDLQVLRCVDAGRADSRRPLEKRTIDGTQSHKKTCHSHQVDMAATEKG